MAGRIRSKISIGSGMHLLLKFALAALLAAFLTFPLVTAQTEIGLDRGRPRISRSENGQPLARALRSAPKSAVTAYLRSHGRSVDVLESLAITKTNIGARGVSHVTMEQRVDGVAIYGAYIKAAMNSKGELIQLIDRLYDVSNVSPSRIDARQALTAAVARLYPSRSSVFSTAGVDGSMTRFDGGEFFYGQPSVTAVALPMEDGTLNRGWLVETWTARTNELYHTVVDGFGRVLDVESRTANDSYNVFSEDPGKGPQMVVNGPSVGDPFSPIGWLDPGTHSTFKITGNNAEAYLDTDANNGADRGGTRVTDGLFLTVADLTADPSKKSNKAVAVQNLFYLTNIAHDTLYRHGFNEAAGNFQVDNFGKGGVAADPVLAESQDGSGTDNANFSTPPDGINPRMQMFLWHPSGPGGEVVVDGTTYDAYPSAFGPSLTTSGITNPLAVADPIDACTSLPRRSMSNKIAIVDRGTCNFTVKVLNAQKAGAKAVIIVNNVPGTITPGGTDSSVRIPSALVSMADGDDLKPQAGASGTLRQNSTVGPLIDSALDSDIVFHEYGHGLTWRMIGAMFGPLSGAVGEGASDVNAFILNEDDKIAEYSADNPLGIRRYPYEGYPLTYRDVAGAEVHDDGEIYAAAMWLVLKNYLAEGLTTDDFHSDFVDGMNFTAPSPSFEDMRDGMLQSAAGTGRECLIWSGFADRGIGEGASGTVIAGVLSITESFAVPADCGP